MTTVAPFVAGELARSLFTRRGNGTVVPSDQSRKKTSEVGISVRLTKRHT